MERYQILHEFMPSKIHKEVNASVLLLKMKRTLKRWFNKISVKK
jgi:hypothetical protein